MMVRVVAAVVIARGGSAPLVADETAEGFLRTLTSKVVSTMDGANPAARMYARHRP